MNKDRETAKKYLQQALEGDLMAMRKGLSMPKSGARTMATAFIDRKNKRNIIRKRVGSHQGNLPFYLFFCYDSMFVTSPQSTCLSVSR